MRTAAGRTSRQTSINRTRDSSTRLDSNAEYKRCRLRRREKNRPECTRRMPRYQFPRAAYSRSGRSVPADRFPKTWLPIARPAKNTDSIVLRANVVLPKARPESRIQANLVNQCERAGQQQADSGNQIKSHRGSQRCFRDTAYDNSGESNRLPPDDPVGFGGRQHKHSAGRRKSKTSAKRQVFR